MQPKFQTAEDALAYAESNRIRIRVHYGDVKTGTDWGDTYMVRGRIGRSMGPVKVRLLIANERSLGGPAMLESSIVRVRYSNRREAGAMQQDLYRHPSYERPECEEWMNEQAWAREFE